MRAFYDRLTGRYTYRGARRSPRSMQPIRTCQHKLVVCACSPDSFPPPPAVDPWAASAVTLAFYPGEHR